MLSYFYFANYGAVLIKDDNFKPLVPLNSIGGFINNGVKASPLWYAGFLYTINMIVRQSGNYYKCNTEHLSVNFTTQIAFWDAI